MPGLFDALKEGTFGIFTGPQDPRVPEGAGRREGLIQAGLATIASGNQDPLEALAQGALVGRQASAQEQERQRQIASRQALQEYMSEVGFSPDGLRRAFIQSLAEGDLEYADTIRGAIAALPAPQAARSRLRAPEPVVNPETGEVEMASFDPDLGRYQFLGIEPAPEVEGGLKNARKIEDPNSSTGWSWIGFDQNLGIERTITGAPPEGGAGAGGPNQAVSGAVLQDLDAAYDPRLADIPTDIKVRLANPTNDPGFIRGTIASIANSTLDPDVQQAAAASARVAGMTQRIMSGAQMSNQERNFYRRAFTIVGGDFPGTQAQKKEAVRLIAQRLGGDSLDAVTARAEEMAQTEEGAVELANIVRDSFSQAGLPSYNPDAPPGVNEGLPDIAGEGRNR